VLVAFGIFHLAKKYPEKVFKLGYWWVRKYNNPSEIDFYIISNPEHEIKYIPDKERAKEVAKNVSKDYEKSIKVDRSGVSVFRLNNDTELRVERTKATTHVLVERDGDNGA